jgi:hypothetical protein
MPPKRKLAIDIIAEVFGPCPDCGNGPCEMNCGAAVIDIRSVAAALVLATENAANADIAAALIAAAAQIHPAAGELVVSRLVARGKLAPAGIISA